MFGLASRRGHGLVCLYLQNNGAFPDRLARYKVNTTRQNFQLLTPSGSLTLLLTCNSITNPPDALVTSWPPDVLVKSSPTLLTYLQGYR